MSQVTIRDLEPIVEAHLRERARIEGRSLSKVASELLANAAGLGEVSKRRDLSRFFATWSAEEAAAFEASLESLNKIDEEIWK